MSRGSGTREGEPLGWAELCSGTGPGGRGSERRRLVEGLRSWGPAGGLELFSLRVLEVGPLSMHESLFFAGCLGLLRGKAGVLWKTPLGRGQD